MSAPVSKTPPRFDRDRSGQLSPHELKRLLDLLIVRPLTVQQLRILLSLIDVDDSNTIGFAEFALAVSQSKHDFVLRDVRCNLQLLRHGRH